MKDIQASGQRVVSFLDDMVDLSRIETGKIDLAFTNQNLNELVENCVAVMQPQANRERIIIRTSLAHALPQVTADARALRQVTMNLISNSIRLASAGGQIIVSTALNDRGEVVGYSTSSSATVAWIWTPTSGFRLVGSTASSTLHDEKALDINNEGQVVGESFSNGAFHAFVWTASGGTRRLPTFTDRDDAHAIGINDHGQIVGQVVTGSRFRAALWTLSSRASRGPLVVIQGGGASAGSPGMTSECTRIQPVSVSGD
jgi:probable HAF family extracellular repeat protein